MSSGFVLVLSGHSGSGKDNVIDALLTKDKDTIVSISMTTRKPRPGEVDGKDYYFVTKEEFEKNIEADEMLEYAKYGDNYYGTPMKPIREWTKQGKTVLLKIEVQGASKIKEKWPEVCTMFLMPPSVYALRQRLEERNTESEEEIEQRLAIARSEISRSYDYDYIIVNDRVDEAVDNILEVINRYRGMIRDYSEDVFEPAATAAES